MEHQWNIPRVHTFSSFDNAYVWTLQKLWYGLTFQMPLVKCFLIRSWIFTLGFSFLLLQMSSLDFYSLSDLLFPPISGGESYIYRVRGTLAWYIKVSCTQRLFFISKNSTSWLDYPWNKCFILRVIIHVMAAVCCFLIGARAKGLYSMSERMIVFSLRNRGKDEVKSA